MPTGPGAPLAPSSSPKPAPSPAAKPEAAAKTPPASAAKPAQTGGKTASPAKPTGSPAGRAPASPAPQPISPVPAAVLTQSSLSALAPPQESAPADPTNYGDRYSRDIFGKPVSNQALIVLHETVGSADSAINTFRTAHTNEAMQSSYHSIIRRNGAIVYIVPPEKRAFGAGNSVFKGPNGEETVKTHRQFPPSVNNFAYHVSLETPPDGANEAETHSGYTDAQYRSLAWLVAHSSVPDYRVTTHRAVDRSGSRIDPRSFDAQKFLNVLHRLPRPTLTGQQG
ncbi:MAG: N-acetylmuramoyl-L-alanine amidase [Elainella sp.]